MIIINWFKILLICLADIVNTIYNPFKISSFAPWTDSLNNVYLEEQFYKHLQTNFVQEGKFSYQLPLPGDEGDLALFQGLYLGMLALKGEDTTAALSYLRTLFINDTLIRGRLPLGTPNDTTSNDSATGVLFGLYYVHKYVGPQSDDLILRWAAQIVKSGYALTDLNGVPTQYGQLDCGWKTDPLRITLLLAILALAANIDRTQFEPQYEVIYAKYHSLVPYAKVSLLWLDTDYDTYRAAIHTRILWELTRDTQYKAGLTRLARITIKQNNALVNILCDSKDLSILSTFDFVAKTSGNIESINSDKVASVKWGSNQRAVQTLPLYRRGNQEFFWQRNMFSLDEWVGIKTANIQYSGLDFLVCYWLWKRGN